MTSIAIMVAFLLSQLCGAAPAFNVGPDSHETLLRCGNAYYSAFKYNCYDSDFLCPILDGEATLRCGSACFLPSQYNCEGSSLAPNSIPYASLTHSSPIPSPSRSALPSACAAPASVFHLSAPPYDNYFYSDCHSSAQVVISSPQSSSNLTLISPRLLVAWPAGNSGIVSYFAPSNGVNGTLSIKLVNRTSDGFITPIYHIDTSSSDTSSPLVGLSGALEFNSSAELSLAILGSIRTIRDFTEGPSILVPEIQDAVSYHKIERSGAVLSRLWLDNVTTTQLSFQPYGGAHVIEIKNETLYFEAGTYSFNASLDYPQLTQLPASKVLNPQSQNLISQESDQTLSLSFLSYTGKLLAGAWRFLTYFGRDSMISVMLLEQVLSEGDGGAIEAVVSAVLERMNSTGTVCHEETIGDYATYTNMKNNITSNNPSCTYIMIDPDYYLPVVMRNYFLNTAKGRSRCSDFFTQEATLDFGNQGVQYSELALRNAHKIMNLAAPFAKPGGQTKENLRHIEADQTVGQWRDSEYGIGGGRVPFDVNTGLVPAALRAISALSDAGFFPEYPGWGIQAAEYAQVWEDHTLGFFEVNISQMDAQSMLSAYTNQSSFMGPAQLNAVDGSGIMFYGLSLDGYNNQSVVKVMNTDVAFRLFLLNTTNDAQLTKLLNRTAQQLILPFPAGLSTDLGIFVANPAYGSLDSPFYAQNWTRAAYHGTVIWSWPMAMLAKGLERQLGRCDSQSINAGNTSAVPSFCADQVVHHNVLKAYNHLWNLIEANRALLSQEVWSWTYNATNKMFDYTSFGTLTPTESDIRQLWSLTFLAVTRNEAFKAT